MREILICLNCGEIITDHQTKICKYCKISNYVSLGTNPSIRPDDLQNLLKISNDKTFIEKMLQLHDTDIVEFTIKMSQLKPQIDTQKYKTEDQLRKNNPTCPRCGSTAITTGARGVNHFWGLIGASQTVNRCANCGHTWKPNGR